MYVCIPCECSACRSQKVSSNPLQELQMMVPYHVGVNDPRFSASKTKCSGWPWTSVIPLPQPLWAGINGMSHHTLRAVSHLSRPNQPLGLISHYGSWRLLSFSFFLFFFFLCHPKSSTAEAFILPNRKTKNSFDEYCTSTTRLAPLRHQNVQLCTPTNSRVMLWSSNHTE